MSRGFRVWDVEAEEYLPNSNGTGDGVLGISADGKNVIWLEDGEATFFEDGRSVIIERSTGLKDENGKEICEGDMVKIWDNKYSGDALGGGYAIEGNWFPMVREVKMDTRGVYAEYPGYMLLRNFANIEVIGNIHENPELLGGEE